MSGSSQRVAVVTGAGTGIGRAVASALLDQGDRVVLVGRREGPLRETAGNHPEASVEIAPTDITSADEVVDLFVRVQERWGRIDLLFNNAGLAIAGGNLEDVAVEDWRAVIDTNLTGSFICAREAFRAMKNQDPQGGRIINNGSLSAHTPRPYAAAYTASKHAITGLTKALALEGRPHSIACGQIDIGNAATALTDAMPAGVPQADGTLRAEPVIDVADVVDSFLLMASLPLTSNVSTLTVMATKMPFVGRG